MIHLSRCLLCCLLVISCAREATAQQSMPSTPPAYKLFRYDEDYRYLQDQSRVSDIWDPIKYIRLGDDPNAFLSLGGEVRERFEYYSAPDFGVKGQSANGYLLHRLLLHSDLHLGEDFRTFVQFGSHLA